jgi:hypothetical protein
MKNPFRDGSEDIEVGLGTSKGLLWHKAGAAEFCQGPKHA